MCVSDPQKRANSYWLESNVCGKYLCKIGVKKMFCTKIICFFKRKKKELLLDRHFTWIERGAKRCPAPIIRKLVQQE